ncbi:MAG TPA: rhodanese-like domain-containing protein [Ferruginibacter sp.]|nr:rhodanese-like domain-containing protein [Ferruginibacter sp.]
MRRRKFVSGIVKGGLLLSAAGSDAFASTIFSKAKQYAGWEVKQFKDKGLAHFSYAVTVDDKIVLVDPGRDPGTYLDYAAHKKARIIAVIETHPHADFVSAHLQLHKLTGAAVYTSGKTKTHYTSVPFDEGDILPVSAGISFRAMNTPGHAPDGISAILHAHGKDVAVFSGDSLLIGDVGRPDLREYSGDVPAQRQVLAAQMYHTIWNKFAPLPADVILYPAHGAGSLCGKSIRDADQSTIGYEKVHNYAFEKRTEKEFVSLILSDLPEVPAYFPYDVALNIKGAENFDAAFAAVLFEADNFLPAPGDIVIDARPEELYKKSHLKNAYNIPDGGKFETWLGSIVHPEEGFYLTAADKPALLSLLGKAAKIGYEYLVKAAFVYNSTSGEQSLELDISDFEKNTSAYTIVDVRSAKEFAQHKIFPSAVNIPLNELEAQYGRLPEGKPVLVHCATGYRSAIGSSILTRLLPNQRVYDLGTRVSSHF